MLRAKQHHSVHYMSLFVVEVTVHGVNELYLEPKILLSTGKKEKLSKEMLEENLNVKGR